MNHKSHVETQVAYSRCVAILSKRELVDAIDQFFRPIHHIPKIIKMNLNFHFFFEKKTKKKRIDYFENTVCFVHVTKFYQMCSLSKRINK